MRTRKITTSTLLSFAMLFASIFVGCVKIPQNDYIPHDGDTVKIIVGYKDSWVEYTVDIQAGETLGGHLDRAVAQNDLNVAYWNEHTSDRFLVELGDLKPNMTKGEYIFVMANIDDPYWTGGMGLVVDYDGQKYYDTNFGFDQMQILQGVNYLFTIISYG